ncbi:MAG TPA: hypothetical protein V6D08_19080 [Candidatus Obscuribacterales bacterium]
MTRQAMEWNYRQDPADVPEQDETLNYKWAAHQYDVAYDHYLSGNWAGAEKHARAAVDANPFEPQYRLLLAQVYCARNKLSVAWSELLILKRQDPHNAGAKSLEALLRRKIEESDSGRRRALRRSGGIFGALAALFRA